MRITLAYPWTDAEGVDHEPDDTVDLDRSTAVTLLRDGRARPATVDRDALESETVPALRAHAAEVGADLTGARTKQDIIQAIDAVTEEGNQ